MSKIVADRRHAAQVEAEDKQSVEHPASKRLKAIEIARQLAFVGEQIEVAEEHAHDEQPTVPAIDNVKKVVD